MTDREPPLQTLPLRLPPAALHDVNALHPDSDESVQQERHRVARELITLHENDGARQSSGLEVTRSSPEAHGSTSIHSRATLGPVPVHYGRNSPQPSGTSTVADPDGPEGYHIARYRLRRQVPHWYDPVARFWTTHISLTIDEGSHRDHLALERTFLGYLRTSLAFAMSGVIIAQLFRLQHSISPSPSIGFFVLGIPLAATFIAFGALVLLFGAFRFWLQQNAMVRGKIYAGGWGILIIMGVSILICTATFVLVMAVDIDKTYF
ncbi:hypothetical protein EJ04DRAFT_489485 [Polyplosphaeria fusca]|uniref:DUF202 domain-containing protein n=1 Tax=Polyplosphaeria fusca TaxID=682080 RepID=A0A9P4R4L4_9PLEO|nr:hypothetical protein EJ04DRAFT_489485 [Polyplosphaeria fusca]